MKPITERLERVESEEHIHLPGADGTTRTITVRVPALRDPKDGEIYLDAEAIALLDRTRARHLGVLAPQELAKLRERLSLTQLQIANLFQIGEKTWSRWETGREVPSRSLNLLILALYEGKIDLAYLRSKQTSELKPAPEPILQVQGWSNLLQTQCQMVWLESKVLAQENWSLELFHDATIQLIATTIQTSPWLTTANPVEATAPSPNRLSAHLFPSLPRERMPLSA